MLYLGTKCKSFIFSWESGNPAGVEKKKGMDYEYYEVEDDGGGNLVVGNGVDINTHRKTLQDFLGPDVEIKKGTKIECGIVDKISDNEIKECRDGIRSYTRSLNLHEYQIDALVSRAYNCGVYGAVKKTRGTPARDFITSYNEYWDEKNDNYFVKEIKFPDFSHKLYMQYMKVPVTSNGEYLKGLENRRKAEWTLFQCGIYAGNGVDLGKYQSPTYTINVTNNINLYNEDGSVNEDKIKALEKYITEDLLHTVIHTSEDDYYKAQKGPFAKWWVNRFSAFQCTWYVCGRANQYLESYGTKYKSLPEIENCHDAKTWFGVLNKYFSSGKTPKPNSIVAWSNKSAGHIAYVEAVDDKNNFVYISHAGNGKKWFGITRHSIQEMSALWGTKLQGYIYLDSPI